MKYDLASDLHIDIGTVSPIDWVNVRNEGSDLLVVAGDISNSAASTIAELRRAATIYNHVIFVDGNHEHYGNRRKYKSVQQNEAEMILELANDHNITFLNVRSPMKVMGNVAFVGCNSWYNFEFYPEHETKANAVAAYLNESNDWSNCNFSVQPEMMAVDHANVMADAVTKLQDYNLVEKIVVITHTAPDSQSLTWKAHDNNWNLLNAAYGNSEMKKVWDADTGEKIVHAVHGHIHDRRDYMLENGIRILANPRGYVHYEPSAAHWMPVQFETDDERGIYKSAFA